jgi:cellulose synthase/poly-beta-1,6-N-acetylglucosamine synthase-like glycosyltransferase
MEIQRLTIIMEIVFFLSLLALLYVYAGYPLLIYCLALWRRRAVHCEDDEPSLTILIAAYNEERWIDATIQNKLSLDYPSLKKEIIIISDGSTDGTDSIVKQYESQGVRLIRQEPRAGKTAALNSAVHEAKGEILVFADANSLYERDAVRKLVRNFADPSVGYVTGKMIYTNEDGTLVGDGCSAYMKYENLLRLHETRVHSVVGVDGGVDAVRKELYRTMRPDQLPDFVLPLRVIEQGYRVVYEPEAVLREAALKAGADEYRMRVRVSLRALWALWDLRRLLNPFRYGVFAWQLLSHKVLRYLSIFFLVGLLLSSALLSRKNSFYTAAFVCQAVFYAMALISILAQKLSQKAGLLYIPYYFTLINVAAGHSLLKFLLGKKQVIWTPRKG